MQTLRFVIVPQAVRRIIPPLLNDFIGLQKDTALVNVIGTIDAFNQAKIIASNHFNLSPVTTVAILFVAHHHSPGALRRPAGRARPAPHARRRQLRAGRAMALIEIRDIHKRFGEHEVFKGLTWRSRSIRSSA